MDAIAGALGIDRAECCPRNPQRGQRGDGRRLRLVSVRRGVDQLILRCSPSAMRQGCMQPRSPISSTLDGRALQRLFAEMESEAMSRLRASPGSTSGAGPGSEITVELDEVDWTEPDPLPQIVERFSSMPQRTLYLPP
jgi:hypothetical protein